MGNRLRAFNYVFGQFALLFLLAFSPRDDKAYGPLDQALGIVGVILIVLGLGVVLAGILGMGKTITASPIPKESGELITTGLYARVRHPIYFGLLLLSFGVILDAGYWPQALVVALLYVLLNSKANWEEDLLKQKYPKYKNYALKTPRFFPRLGR